VSLSPPLSVRLNICPRLTFRRGFYIFFRGFLVSLSVCFRCSTSCCRFVLFCHCIYSQFYFSCFYVCFCAGRSSIRAAAFEAFVFRSRRIRITLADLMLMLSLVVVCLTSFRPLFHSYCHATQKALETQINL
jgi:hypothetical protein